MSDVQIDGITALSPNRPFSAMQPISVSGSIEDVRKVGDLVVQDLILWLIW